MFLINEQDSDRWGVWLLRRCVIYYVLVAYIGRVICGENHCSTIE